MVLVSAGSVAVRSLQFPEVIKVVGRHLSAGTPWTVKLGQLPRQEWQQNTGAAMATDEDDDKGEADEKGDGGGAKEADAAATTRAEPKAAEQGEAEEVAAAAQMWVERDIAWRNAAADVSTNEYDDEAEEADNDGAGMDNADGRLLGHGTQGEASTRDVESDATWRCRPAGMR